ncbi:hypothetical protein B9Z55_024787 [Caenorhabditis nigoni]|uniref:Uncharacterized protein n=1 Tax=Caenorhabditis nigoni TaxID=1611254 RepID=A0A2G5SW00_9PELO|nr:hypothetical protein B9Z55_024787 [Caenorhabditis nigoni]
MSSNILLVLFLLFLITKSVHGYVNCVNSFNGRSFGVAQCATNYCKKYTGGSGIVQLSCDDTGDCQRSFERTFIGPVQMYAFP